MTREASSHQPWSREQVQEALTALWALSEAGMGGLVHAIKIPLTGIVLGASAVILISTLAFFAERKAAAILRATVVVLLVKAAASPHTPIPAYFAVAFQGLAGALLFEYLPWHAGAAVLLGLLAFWQGAAQKLLVVTLLYGRGLWESLDTLGRSLLARVGGAERLPISPTAAFLWLYAGYYTLGGLITAWIAATLPREVARALEKGAPNPAGAENAVVLPLPEAGRGKPFWRRFPVKAGLVTAGLCLALIWIAPDAGGWARGLRTLLRAAIVVTLWSWGLRPTCRRILARFQVRAQTQHGAEAVRILAVLPRARALAAAAWEASRSEKRLLRVQRFFVAWLTLALQDSARKSRELSRS